MNTYLKNLEKLEFILTYACSGKCKHCSEGDHALKGEKINADEASAAVLKLSGKYDLKTVLVFGGEPLLYPFDAAKIIKAAKDAKIPKRQIITNGFFSRDREKIKEIAKLLFESGVNDLLLSVDAFHQETIPLEVVKVFAKEAKAQEIPVRLQPAWLVSDSHDNPYNRKTREILDSFRDTGIPIGSGNVVFPEGNAKKYLAEYFGDFSPENPYQEDPCNVKCLSFEPNGTVLGGNFYETDVFEIIEAYTPEGEL